MRALAIFAATARITTAANRSKVAGARTASTVGARAATTTAPITTAMPTIAAVTVVSPGPVSISARTTATVAEPPKTSNLTSMTPTQLSRAPASTSAAKMPSTSESNMRRASRRVEPSASWRSSENATGSCELLIGRYRSGAPEAGARCRDDPVQAVGTGPSASLPTAQWTL
jgi:hypothetical protein